MSEMPHFVHRNVTVKLDNIRIETKLRSFFIANQLHNRYRIQYASAALIRMERESFYAWTNPSLKWYCQQFIVVRVDSLHSNTYLCITNDRSKIHPAYIIAFNPPKDVGFFKLRIDNGALFEIDFSFVRPLGFQCAPCDMFTCLFLVQASCEWNGLLLAGSMTNTTTDFNIER